jgi:hypothetical protein
MNRAVTPIRRVTAAAPLEEEAPPQALTDYALVGQFGAELAEPINTMHNIVQDFNQSRHMSHAQMVLLVSSVEAALNVTRQSQQIARLAEGRLRQSHERIRLDELLHQTLSELSPALKARGIDIHRNIKPVEIIIDPGLLSSLVESALTWGCSQGKRVVVSLGIKNWPEHGMLAIKASNPPGTLSAPVQADTLAWQLLVLTAQVMGVTLEREITANGEAMLLMEFARTVKQLEGLTAVEMDASGDSSFHNGTKPMAGMRILLISNDSMVRGEVDEAGRLLGLMVDKVPSVEQAERYVKLGMPHLIIIDERLNDDSFGRLQNDITSTDPNLGFIEIADESNTFEISSWMSDSMTRVSRDVMRAQLPSVLTLELARAL